MEPITDLSDPLALFRGQRQVRKFADRPLEDGTLETILQAAVHGPSGSNSMPWRFIVVRDPETKQRLGDIYEACFAEQYGGNAPPRGQDRQHLADVPVLIVPCVRTPRNGRAGFQTGASVYPSVQNLLLAARAMGVASGITTLHRIKLAEVHEILGIPEGWDSAAIVLLGWPDRSYGPNKRPPLERFVTYERWTDPVRR
jgi:nitroreductase